MTHTEKITAIREYIRANGEDAAYGYSWAPSPAKSIHFSTPIPYQMHRGYSEWHYATEIFLALDDYGSMWVKWKRNDRKGSDNMTEDITDAIFNAIFNQN